MTTSLCLTHPACPPRSGPPPRLRARRRGIRLLGVWLLLAGAAGARAAEPPALEPAPQEFPSVLDNGAAQADVRAGEAENLEDVYTAALHNDHTLAAAQATYRAGLEEEVLARAELLPSVDASSDYREEFTEARGQFPAGGQLFPNSTDTDTGSFAFAFNLSQPVFDLPAWFRFQRGRALSERAEAEFAAAQQDLILRVTEAYFEVLSSRVNLRAARARETAFRSQLEQARQRFEVGLIAVTDVHEARAAYDLAVAERLANEGEVGIALEQLSVLTGESHRALWRLQEDYPVIDPEPLDTDQWVEFAVENSYDIKTAVHARRAADEAARAASAEHLPKVELSLGYNESNSDLTQEDVINDVTNQFSSDRNNRFIGLAVEVPLFAGGGISARRRQAAAEASTATEQYLETVRRVKQETRALFIRVTSDVARSRARRQAIVSSRSALEASEDGYAAGTRDIVDVLAAQRALFAAQRDYANARIDYVTNKIRLKREAGTLTPADIHALNEWLEPPAAGGENTDQSGAQ